MAKKKNIISVLTVISLVVVRVGKVPLLLGGPAGGRLPVRPEPGGADVGLCALPADEGPLVGVQTLVQLEVHELGEARAAGVAPVRLEAGVEPHVRLQVGRGAELLAALLARVGLLA